MLQVGGQIDFWRLLNAGPVEHMRGQSVLKSPSKYAKKPLQLPYAQFSLKLQIFKRNYITSQIKVQKCEYSNSHSYTTHALKTAIFGRGPSPPVQSCMQVASA